MAGIFLPQGGAIQVGTQDTKTFFCPKESIPPHSLVLQEKMGRDQGAQVRQAGGVASCRCHPLEHKEAVADKDPGLGTVVSTQEG